MPSHRARQGIIAAPLWMALSILIVISRPSTAAEKGELELTVIDHDTAEPIAARLRILSSAGRMPRMRNVIRQGFDVTFVGPLTIQLPIGRYTFSLDRGPHYRQRTGHLQVRRDGFDQKTLDLPRIANLQKEGWYGGDLVVARPHQDLPLLLQAEELDAAVIPTWTAGRALTKFQAKRNRATQMIGAAFGDFSGWPAPNRWRHLLGSQPPRCAGPGGDSRGVVRVRQADAG